MSKIEWTDETWNPTTGCTRVSEGCDNCYMFSMWPRLQAMRVKGYEHEPDYVRHHSSRLSIPYRWKKPRRVFVNSMSDLFHRDVTDEFIDEVFRVMIANPQHTFQILTKRPRRAARWYRDRGGRWQWRIPGIIAAWPANVWLGVSIESEKHVLRIKELHRIPASVRFISAEPLLGLIDLYMVESFLGAIPADWVIAGGESGPGARPMHPSWARVLKRQCQGMNIPFFLKQLGGYPDKRGGDKALLDGRLHQEFPSV